jgi:hypothetical protein
MMVRAGNRPLYFESAVPGSHRWIKYADVKEVGFVNDAEGDARNVPLQAHLPARRFVNVKTFDPLTHTAPISMEPGPDCRWRMIVDNGE